MEEQEFSQFYEATAEGLWRYIYSLVGREEEAGDLVQESYLRWWRKPPRWGSAVQKKAYLYRIATHLVYDRTRAFRRRSRFLERWRRTRAEVPDSVQEPRDMWKLLQQLSPRDRALIWLAYFEGFRYDEIAAAMGWRKESVGVMLYRARKRFAQILEQAGYAPEVKS